MTALGSLPLSETAFDRNGIARVDERFLDSIRADSRTLAVLVRGRDVAVDGETLALLPLSGLTDSQSVVYLGTTTGDEGGVPAGTPIVAARADDEQQAWVPLRDVAAVLSVRDAGLAAAAVAVMGWHETSRFCPRCGTETRVGHAGWMRWCEPCQAEHFPRTDPAVIVRVTDADNRILLGSNAAWETGRYSLFAGFVEAGESLEAAVVREVYEEAGVRVADPRYLGSQPWPFPRSLMLGFAAQLDAEQAASDTTPDGDEILEVRWFTRDELRDPSSGVLLPGRSSIAHAIIEQWLVGE
ncbi:NAD(+) diphosphatase [Paramicrobacterium agarici]|uniref:NAD(+) diphosphatase n=1 Tax=Paramicrobacterium agarici TaxID=630514 RepID=UPI001152E7F8|nr:NAD(+) diphosphatase [Microbacterium agarici]TQO21547.1 NAD+ diphosphatase [Microbacterium agarici]